MRVIFIRKKTLVNIFAVIIIVLISVIYTKGIGKGTIGTFLNNEKIMPIHSVDVPDRRVALTFDAAWGDQYTKDIVDVLKRYDIKATFFLTGAWVDRHEDMARDIYSRGHEIGNHSATHVKLTDVQSEEIIYEVKTAENSIKKVTGKKPTLFRVPFGEYDNRVITALKKTNYSVIQWDLDSLDWKGFSSADILKRVASKINNGSIVLFHSNISNTPVVLPELIENLRKTGYKFVTVSELLLKENYYIDNTGRQKSLK